MIPRYRQLLLATAMLGTTHFAVANVEVRFVESAPKDWFAVTNNGNCTIQQLTFSVDLTNSVGKLIFDTSAAGAGVEVYQPFEVRSGSVKLVSKPTVNDGDTRLSVQVTGLQPGMSASFTIDVDDTLTNGELGMIRVSGNEISGTEVSISTPANEAISGVLSPEGNVSLFLPGC